MARELKILIVEGIAADAGLIEAELHHAGIIFSSKRVETRQAFLKELQAFTPDLILADYLLPQFDGLTTLRLTQELAPAVPVIIIAASIDEEAAVACLEHGAADYVIKEHLVRLGSVVKQVIEQKQAKADQERTEQDLRQSRELFRLISENVADLIVVIDLTGQRLYGNPAYRKMLDMMERGGDTDFFTELHPDDRAKARRIFQKTITSGHVQQTEYRVLLKGGAIRYFESQWNIIRTEQGQVEKVVIVSRDITERKEAEVAQAELEKQLQHSQKFEALGRLASGIAHDFNNLLTAILSYADLALEALPEDNPSRADIESIKTSVQHAANLTHQLVTFARKQNAQPKILNLAHLINTMDKFLHRLIGEDIELITQSPPDLGRIKAGPGQLEQVLVNLAVNARDAMPNGGKLIIETANVSLTQPYAYRHGEIPAGEYVMLAVSDNGIGMSEEVKAHLFEPFFTTKSGNKETGLGLATCLTIVKQNQGHILVYSEQGLGTTVKIYLPRVEEGIGLIGRRSQSDRTSPGTATILVAEDEMAVRDMIVRVLRQQGYTVIEATDGEEALRLAQEHPGHSFNLLLTDVVMPQMGGVGLVDRLKATHPDIKVLFMSGYTDEAIIHQGLLEPKHAFLPKPFSPSLLVSKVREVLDR